MKAVRHLLEDALANAAGEQRIDKPDGDRDIGDDIETEHDDRPADGADCLMRRVVERAIREREHLGGHRRVLQDHLGKAAGRGLFVVSDGMDQRDSRAEDRHFLFTDQRNPFDECARLPRLALLAQPGRTRGRHAEGQLGKQRRRGRSPAATVNGLGHARDG